MPCSSDGFKYPASYLPAFPSAVWLVHICVTDIQNPRNLCKWKCSSVPVVLLVKRQAEKEFGGEITHPDKYPRSRISVSSPQDLDNFQTSLS